MGLLETDVFLKLATRLLYITPDMLSNLRRFSKDEVVQKRLEIIDTHGQCPWFLNTINK